MRANLLESVGNENGMRLRDLKPDKLRELQERCLTEYAAYKEAHPNKTEQDVWQWAWSRGCSAGLELMPDQNE